MTWALVPLIPNEDTPARRGGPSRGQGTGLGQQLHRPGRPVHLRGRLVHVQGLRQRPVRASPCTILITPATPAAAWVWPMFDFTDPSHNGRPSGRSCP